MMYDDEWKVCIPHDAQEQANLLALSEYLNNIYYC